MSLTNYQVLKAYGDMEVKSKV